jgi:hypothetical protein
VKRLLDKINQYVDVDGEYESPGLALGLAMLAAIALLESSVVTINYAAVPTDQVIADKRAQRLPVDFGEWSHGLRGLASAASAPNISIFWQARAGLAVDV